MPDEVMRSYEFGVFRFDVRERMLACNGQPVPLTPKAADLLLVLLQNRGDLVSKDALIKAVWPNTFVADSSLAFQLSAVRRALAPSGHWIETLPRRGYRFIAPVREVFATGAGAPRAAMESPKEDTHQ